MMNFENIVISNTVKKLLSGKDYRTEIINVINTQFLDFAIIFFKDIVKAKINSQSIDLEWYKINFIQNSKLTAEESAIYAGMNKKTITNIYGSATKQIILDVAETNFTYLSNLIGELNLDSDNDSLNIQIKICYKNVSVELSLSESLLVINALATKKLAIRGGAWSSIGKKVEKPLMLALCEYCGVPQTNINSEVFIKNNNLDFDREVDFKLYTSSNKEIRCEVKLMGRGNPESADVIIARETNIFIADTLSEQNKKQFNSLGICWLELKNNTYDNIIIQFKKILDILFIPHK